MILQFDGLTPPPQKMNFNSERLWVQMHDLPLVCMNREQGQILGGTIGRVVEVDTKVDESGWGMFLSILIEINFLKPLVRGRTIIIKEKAHWIPIKYEKLPHFYFRCGCMVHNESGCKGKVESEAQSGACLRAMVRVKKKEGY